MRQKTCFHLHFFPFSKNSRREGRAARTHRCRVSRLGTGSGRVGWGGHPAASAQVGSPPREPGGVRGWSPGLSGLEAGLGLRQRALSPSTFSVWLHSPATPSGTRAVPGGTQPLAIRAHGFSSRL